MDSRPGGETAKQTSFKRKTTDSITINGSQAQVKITLRGLVELPTFRPADGNFEATFDWQKEKDGWRLTRASWREAP